MKKLTLILTLFVLFMLTAQVNSQTMYGYNSNGFFLHKTIASLISEDAPEIITRITAGQPLSMTLEGDYWWYHTKKNLGSTEKYCFKVGEEYIPYVFVSEWDHPAKEHLNMVNKEDIVSNGKNGFDFKTGKQ